IYSQVSQSKVGESAEYVGVAANVLVATGHEFVSVAAGRRRAQVIEGSAGPVCRGVVFCQQYASGLAEFGGGNAIAWAGWIGWVQPVRGSRPRGSVHIVRIVNLPCGVVA